MNLSPKKISLALPVTGPEELDAVRGVFASGYLAQGPAVARFEEEIAARVGTRFAFAMSSATTALHLALVALGVGPGDEVLVPDFTFPATANVVVQQGGIPVLVDIEPETFTMDIEDLRRKVTSRSKVVMPVHAFGAPADIDPIRAVADSHGLRLVEDAACALAATYRGRQCGTLGDVACFSLHPRKIITTGEGGLITTDDQTIADRVRILRSHGGIRTGGRFVFEMSGFNYRMSDIQAAIGSVQLVRLERFLWQRRAIAAQLTNSLMKVEGLRLPSDPQWGEHTYQSYVVLLDEGIDRDAVIQHMAADNIETTIGTYALHAQPAFRRYGYRPRDLPNSSRAFKGTLALPMHPALTESEIGLVAQSLESAIVAQRQPGSTSPATH